ncbi:MAG TPA: hypothetical protein VFP54_09175 [Acidimicrobiales bacterium]|nr:hypothetical protein [Acidimicrobiales bacterium]
MTAPPGPGGAGGVSRALILSGSIGMGHDVVAEGCASALAALGVSSEIVDCMALLGRLENATARAMMKGLMAVPGLYDAFHFAVLRPGRWPAARLDEEASTRLAAALSPMMDGVDMVLSVYATGGAAADSLKRSHGGFRSVVYCTDACPHRLWVHPGTDLFLVTSDMSAAFVRYHRPDAEVAVVAPAARDAFYSPPTRAAAREALGLPLDQPCVLIMGGAWGMAPVDRAAAAVAAHAQVLAVAGTNRRLEVRLRRLARSQPRITPFGFTDRVVELMAAADVVVTTPGDTCTEARLVGRPMVLLDTVPGHGRENLQLELQRGGATAAAAAPEVIAAAVRRFLDDPPPLPDAGHLRDWSSAFTAAVIGRR